MVVTAVERGAVVEGAKATADPAMRERKRDKSFMVSYCLVCGGYPRGGKVSGMSDVFEVPGIICDEDGSVGCFLSCFL